MSTLASLRLRPAVAGGVRPRARLTLRANGAAVASAVTNPPQRQRLLGSPHARRVVASARWAPGQQLRAIAGSGGGGRRLCRLVIKAHGDHAHGSPADDCCGGGCSNRPSFSGGDRKSSKSKNNNVGGSSAAAPAYAGEMDGLSPDGSFDEEAFLSEAGMGSGDDASIAATMRSGNFIERALTSFYRLTRVGWLADKMRGNATLCAVSWFFLLVGGVAHVCRHTGVDTPTSLAVENAATIIVYALAGTSEFVDVSYELAVGNVNIHVLTTLAVLGTIAVGCAMEGALLLVLFASAHFVEQRLTGHARGDLKSLWATVPGEANVVDLNSDGSPNAASERLVPARDVAVGTTVFVKAGQQVPLDGVVVHGSALVSIQHITGEALPVVKRVGDEIPAGAVNSDGALVVRSLRSAEDSTPARIARLTEAAQNRRPAVSRLLDTFGDRYSKAILAVTALTMVVGPLCLGWPLMGRGGAMYRAFAFLSAAAPCALLMSPLVYVAAIGACARRGVLVRGGVTFDALAECGTVALDKTGTITTGQMSCTSIETVHVAGVGVGFGEVEEAGAAAGAGGRRRVVVEAARGVVGGASGGVPSSVLTASPPSSNPTALAIAASLERGASHPIGRAVLDTAAVVGLQVATGKLPDVAVSNFKVVHGAGVEGLVRPGVVGVDCGPARLARFGAVEWATEIAGTSERVAALRRRVLESASEGAAVKAVLVVQDAPHRNGSSGNGGGEGEGGEGCDVDVYDPAAWTSDNLSCVFSFSDSLHPKAAKAVEELSKGAWRDQGMRLLMLTGDNPKSAAAIAQAVGLPSDAVNAGLTPGDKLRIVEQARKEAQAEGRKYLRIAMVGDGINDAPALAAADVGVAVASTPSEAAAAAADVLLLHTDSDGISQLPELFDLAARTRAVLRQNITLAVVSIVGSSLPALFGAFPLWLAVLLHEGSTLLVAINSVRLLGTFGRQPMRKSTAFAVFAVFGLCCLGGAWGLNPAIRASSAGWLGTVIATPAFMAAGLAMKSAWAGLLAGCLHTLTGPDHLAALAPLCVSPSRAQNAMMGALWGCGHNTGQILFGLIFVLLRDKLPFNMELISQWGQGIVGATLVIIGALGFWEAREMAAGRGHSHSHSHSHGLPFGLGGDLFDGKHAHAHSHSHDEGDSVANVRFAHAHAEGEEPHSHGEGEHDHSHDHGHEGHAGHEGHSHSHSGGEREREGVATAAAAAAAAAAGSVADNYDGHHGMGSVKKSVDGPWEADEAEEGSGESAAAVEARRRQKDGSFLSWTYITGTIHGLQPDALLLLLPAFALPRLQAMAFLGTFFIGTIVAMGTYTACLGAGTSALQKHNPKAVSVVSSISSAIALSIGFAFILSAIFGFEIF